MSADTVAVRATVPQGQLRREPRDMQTDEAGRAPEGAPEDAAAAGGGNGDGARRGRGNGKGASVPLLGREVPMPESRPWRIVVGSLLVVFGVFGFLPVLGFWMIPLGLLVLSYELAVVRRWRRRAVVWWHNRNGRRRRTTPAAADRQQR